MSKDVQFAFRVESTLREQFVLTCRRLDKPAGQVLREFIREFIGNNIQGSLFDQPIERLDQSSLLGRQENK